MDPLEAHGASAHPDEAGGDGEGCEAGLVWAELRRRHGALLEGGLVERGEVEHVPHARVVAAVELLVDAVELADGHNLHLGQDAMLRAEVDHLLCAFDAADGGRDDWAAARAEELRDVERRGEDGGDAEEDLLEIIELSRVGSGLLLIESSEGADYSR